MERSPEAGPPGTAQPMKPERSVWDSVLSPGLTPAAEGIARLLRQLPKKWDVFSYKKSRDFLWVVFIGGTGTGKSTIFNALCGKPLSETGVERPKTFGPIAYLHANTAIEKDFPFPLMETKRLAPAEAIASPHGGAPGELLLLEHLRDDLSHLVLVDTPDVDSLEWRNREMVEDLYLLADVVIFVTSQEKYADDVPFQFLSRIHKEGKPYLVLLNKAESELVPDEVLASIRTQGLYIPDERFLSLPYLSSHSYETLSRESSFRDFESRFSRMLAKSEMPYHIRNEKIRGVGELQREMQLLLELLDKENEAARKWLDHLEIFFRANCQKLFEQQERHLTEDTREYLQQEVRKLYSKYDLLGKPRRLIAQVVLSPLQALGLVNVRPQESHEEVLRRIRQKIDLVPTQAALESFNRSVLEKLSPEDESSPLYKKLRDPDIVLTYEEIRNLVWEEQEKLVLWLEQTFDQLARGIPKSKEWGIYSTSVLWGGMILSLEVVVGGGISILEAVLDSAIAPFVTKGAVELFAYHELQRIARELSERYREGLVSVVRRQRDRYAHILQSLAMRQEDLESLRSLMRSLHRAV